MSFLLRIHPSVSQIISLSPSPNSVSDAAGQMKVVEVAARPLTQDLLDHNVSERFNKH